MFTKRTQTFVFFCISVMAENEIKTREAKLDFDDDVLAGKKVKLEMNLQDMACLFSAPVRGRCESVEYFEVN